ncbi:hypothetical protein NL676_035196 [Syzygium grande]|nr:hypothetical protein NL676_035196 [Syzygium grande]
MMGTAEDGWVAAAMADSGVAAELLVLLKGARAAAAPAPAKPAIVPPMRWGLRQPRSRMAPRCDVAAAAASQRKEADSARNSPTTPLSWSGGGGASPSATAEGFEESSLRANGSSGSARSKGTAPNDAAASCLAAVNKPRKKKTFAELKDEESYLLNERIHLDKDIARLRAAFAEQRARNESLKRMKLDLNLLSGEGNVVTADDRDEATSGLHDKTEASTSDRPASSTLPEHDKMEASTSQCHPSSSFSQFPRPAIKDSDRSFVLPDLNMMPSEEDSRPEDFCGLS